MPGCFLWGIPPQFLHTYVPTFHSRTSVAQPCPAGCLLRGQSSDLPRRIIPTRECYLPVIKKKMFDRRCRNSPSLFNGACPKCRRTMRIISFIEDREVIKTILKHLRLWLVKSRPTPKAHAPPALNQNGSGPAGYILDHFSPLHMNDDPLYPAKRGTTPGTLTFSPKDPEYGRKEPVCPDEPQKRLTSLAKSLKRPPRPLYPEIPRISAEKAAQQTQDLVRTFP